MALTSADLLRCALSVPPTHTPTTPSTGFSESLGVFFFSICGNVHRLLNLISLAISLSQVWD